MDTVSFLLVQPASLPAADVGGAPSYFDRVLGDVTDAEVRARPGPGSHSLLWLLWHMARTEDVSGNLVVTDGRQVLDDDWVQRL